MSVRRMIYNEVENMHILDKMQFSGKEPISDIHVIEHDLFGVLHLLTCAHAFLFQFFHICVHFIKCLNFEKSTTKKLYFHWIIFMRDLYVIHFP